MAPLMQTVRRQKTALISTLSVTYASALLACFTYIPLLDALERLCTGRLTELHHYVAAAAWPLYLPLLGYLWWRRSWMAVSLLGLVVLIAIPLAFILLQSESGLRDNGFFPIVLYAAALPVAVFFTALTFLCEQWLPRLPRWGFTLALTLAGGINGYVCFFLGILVVIAYSALIHPGPMGWAD